MCDVPCGTFCFQTLFVDHWCFPFCRVVGVAQSFILSQIRIIFVVSLPVRCSAAPHRRAKRRGCAPPVPDCGDGCGQAFPGLPASGRSGRLIRNNYQFTISERTAANLKEAMEQGNNILGFLKSEGCFEIRQGAKCKSTDFYKVYERWCLDNLEKPLAASTFIHHLKDNQKSLGIVYDDKCIGTNRGFHNVDVDLFLPVDVPSPWD